MKENQGIVAEAGRDGADVERTRAEHYYSPDVDIMETNNEIVVMADIPGADEQSVDITLENDILRIEAAVARRDQPGHGPSLREYGVGPFARSFLITGDVDRQGIEASVRNGTLRIRLPKVQEARSRKIAVKKE